MRSSFTRVLVILLTAALITAAALVLAFAGTLQYLGPEIPAAAQLREIRVQLPLQVRSRDDKLIAQFVSSAGFRSDTRRSRRWSWTRSSRRRMRGSTAIPVSTGRVSYGRS
jgi:hypothetical protein